MNNKESLISIIIPVYNEEIIISNILKNFYDIKKKLKLELIIINDGSTMYNKYIKSKQSFI